MCYKILEFSLEIVLINIQSLVIIIIFTPFLTYLLCDILTQFLIFYTYSEPLIAIFQLCVWLIFKILTFYKVTNKMCPF